MIKKTLPISSFLLGMTLFNFNFIVLGIVIFSLVVLLNFEKDYVPVNQFFYFSLPLIFILITSLSLDFFDVKWVEKRTSFILFPFLFFYSMRSKKFYIIKKNIFKGFIWGGFITSILLLFIATYKSIKNSGFTYYNSEISHLSYSNYFLHTSLSQPVKLHPSYISLYLLVAIILIINKEVILNYKMKNIFISLFIILLVLLQAKIILPLIIIFAIIYLRKNQKIVLYTIPIVLVIIVANKRLLISNFNPPNKVTKSLYLSKGWNAINIRMELNKVSLDLLRKVNKKELIFGIGPDELKKRLQKSYKDKYLMYFAKKRLGLHNQYYVEFLEGGVISLIGLLIFMIYLFKSSLKLKNTTFLFISITVILYSFLEEFVSLQSGIILITLFSSIYIKQLRLELQKKSI